MRSQLAVLAESCAVSMDARTVAAQDHDHARPDSTKPASTSRRGRNAEEPGEVDARFDRRRQENLRYAVRHCHGETGKGDGKMAASITGAKPSDLTDASWKHGSTDGEIFTLIRDGSKGTGMRGFAARMKTDDIWNVVNYSENPRTSQHKKH